MPVSILIAWTCVFHLVIFSLILFVKASRRSANYALGIFMLSFAYVHLNHLFLLYGIAYQVWFINELVFIAIFCIGPSFLQYVAKMTGNLIAWRKYPWLHLLPLLPSVVYLCTFFSNSTEDIRVYYEESLVRQPLSNTWLTAFATMQMALYIIWALVLLAKYNTRIACKPYYRSLNLRWLQLFGISLIGLCFIILPIMILLSASDALYLFVIMPVVTTLLYLFLFYKALTFPDTATENGILRHQEREKIDADVQQELVVGLQQIEATADAAAEQLMGDERFERILGQVSTLSKKLYQAIKEGNKYY